MNVFKRGMIFVTFFGCCFGMALMAAALGTEFWFQADAVQKDKTTNFTEFRSEAHGKLNFGLFRGDKLLNWGIGDRASKFKGKSRRVLKYLGLITRRYRAYIGASRATKTIRGESTLNH